MRNREREHKQHPEQLGRLGDERDRLDRLGQGRPDLASPFTSRLGTLAGLAAG